MDHTVGMHASIALMAALHRRKATGEGTHVDVAAREVAASLIGEALLVAAAGGEVHRMGNAHGRMAPHGVYPAAGEDRWLSIAVEDDAEWRSLAGLIGCDDARFATEAGRQTHRAEIDAAVAAWKSSRDWRGRWRRRRNRGALAAGQSPAKVVAGDSTGRGP